MNRLTCLILCVFTFSALRAQKPLFNGSFGTYGEVQIDNLSCPYGTQNINGIHAMASFPNGELLGAFILGTVEASSAQYGLIKFFPNGSTDSSFGINGIVTVAPAPIPITVQSVQIQTDGKILLAGTGNGLTELIRLLPDGQLDSTLNGSGIASFELLRTPYFSTSNENDYVSDVLLQTDGKYLLLGGFNTIIPTATSAPGVTRINADGSLDSTFGVNGVATLPALQGVDFKGLLTPNGSIILIGSTKDNNDNNYTAQAERLTASGLPDNTFGASGLITYTGLGPAVCHQLLGLSNGSYYMLANTNPSASTDTGYFITRFQPNGLSDPTFAANTNGRFTPIASQGSNMKFFDMDTLPDGSLVVLNGTDPSSLRQGSFLINVTTSGTLNTNFGTAGIDNLPDSAAYCVQMDPYTKNIYAYDAKGPFALSAFNADGTINTSFGNNGAMTTDVQGGGVTVLQGLGLTSDKKILALGHYESCASPNGTLGFYLNRYLPNGAPDNTFGNKGSVKWTLGAGNAHPLTIDAMAVTPDNGVIFGGMADSAGAYIEKHNADGSLDSSFGILGSWKSTWHYLDNGSKFFGALAVQADGKIVYAATEDSIYEYDVYGHWTVIGRLTAQGQPDPSFGVNGSIRLAYHGESTAFNPGDAIAIRPNGDILVTSSNDSGIQVIQLTPNGTLDAGFGNQGVFQHSYNQQGYLTADDIKIQPDSSAIVLYGTFPTGPLSAGQGIGILRLLPNGQVDSNFTNGAYDPAVALVANQIQLQDDGRILIPAITQTSEPHFAILRLRPDGRADNTFGQYGVVTIGNRDAIPTSVYEGGDGPEFTTPILMTRQDSADYILGGTIQDLATKAYLTSFYAKDSVLPNDADTMSITLSDTTYPTPCHTIRLSWITRNDTTSHYFSIQRTSQYGGTYTPIAMILPTAHAHGPLQYFYTDSFPLPNYNWYRVQLVMGGDSLLTSNQWDWLSDTSSPGKVEKPAATYTVSQGIYSSVITWKVDNQKILDSINILRAQDNGAFTETGWQSPEPAGTQNTYSAPDPNPLQAGHTYSYKIELFGADCVNAFSDTAMITLPVIDTTTGPGSGNGSGNGSGGTTPGNPGNPTDTITNVKVYPNPATSEINVATPAAFGSGTIEILSFDGKILYRQPVTAPANGILPVNIGWLDPGIYYLKLINSQQVWVVTFLKT